MKHHEEWLEAYKETLRQYEERIHMNSDTTCPKCMFARTLSNQFCVVCPESIFEGDDLPYMACIFRLTRPLQFSDFCLINGSEENLEKVILYHKKAIEYLENNPECSFRDFQEEIERIDSSI